MKVAVGGEKVQLPSGARLPQVVQEQAHFEHEVAGDL
jgi:hypothetical protein